MNCVDFEVVGQHQESKGGKKMTEKEKANSESMPDAERRRLLKKLAVAGIAVPTAILLVDGSKNVSFGY